MTVTLSGMALLPTEETMETFISFREQCGNNVHGPKLGKHSNVPHVSILQCPFNINQLSSTMLETIVNQFKQQHSNHVFTSHYTELYYQPVGWYFADIDMETWGTVLQNIALTNLQQHIDEKSIIIDDSYHFMPPLEQYNQKTYGYRYMGEAYRPHITLGVTPTGAETLLPPTVKKLYEKFLYGTTVNFDRAVFYIAGKHGAAEEIIAELSL